MKKRIYAIILVTLFIFILSACGKAEEAQKITFVLDWTPNTNHTGLYVAQEKGYFKEAGLEVEIQQPPEDGAAVLVASGKADFGVSFQDSMAAALAGDNPLPITAVASVIQHNTSGIISRVGEGMKVPKGMEGHSYATWNGAIELATLEQVIKADGGDFSKVELIPSTVTDEVSALKTKSVDSIWVFYAWAGVKAELEGLDTDYFEFADIDPVFDYYTPVIVANNAFLKENPEKAKAEKAAQAPTKQIAKKKKKSAAGAVIGTMGVLIVVAAAAVGGWYYLADKQGKDNLKKEVVIEAGSSIKIEDFFSNCPVDAKFVTDVSDIDTDVPAVYQLTISYEKAFTEDVTLKIEDHTGPDGKAVSQRVYTTWKMPEAEECVDGLYDLSVPNGVKTVLCGCAAPITCILGIEVNYLVDFNAVEGEALECSPQNLGWERTVAVSCNVVKSRCQLSCHRLGIFLVFHNGITDKVVHQNGAIFQVWEMLVFREIFLNQLSVFIHFHTICIGEDPDIAANAGRMLSNVHIRANLKDGGAAL